MPRSCTSTSPWESTDHQVKERLLPGQHRLRPQVIGRRQGSHPAATPHGGYTFAEFRHDVESDSIQALRRIDHKVVFYGGMPVYSRGASHFGARLDAGRDFIDFDSPRFVRLRVE